MNTKAPLASPTFTGSPKATTPSSTDNSTRIATTAFVKALVGAANNGGIVSANLAQNGYVKFANGFILQWRVLPSGYYYNNDITVDYPIAFPSAVWGIVITPHDTNKFESAYFQILVTSVNNSSCVLNNSSGKQLNSGYMLCFGT